MRATVSLWPAELRGMTELIAGVQMKDIAEFSALKLRAVEIMEAVVNSRPCHQWHEWTVAELAELVEAGIKAEWPERAYFLEVCCGGERDGWVQIFQPYDKPVPPDPLQHGAGSDWDK